MYVRARLEALRRACGIGAVAGSAKAAMRERASACPETTAALQQMLTMVRDDTSWRTGGLRWALAGGVSVGSPVLRLACSGKRVTDRVDWVTAPLSPRPPTHTEYNEDCQWPRTSMASDCLLLLLRRRGLVGPLGHTLGSPLLVR